MRVIIITMGLSRIVKPIVEEYDVVGIIECAPRRLKNKTKQKVILSKLIVLYRLLQKRKNLQLYSTDNDIPYYYMDNGSDTNLESWVRNLNPDVIVVSSMSQLLKKNIFSIPKYGTINLHPAYLPSYRGPNPWFWSYYNMDKKGGVTLHYIDEGEDTGDIIFQEEYEIPLGMKSPEMQDKAIGKIGNKLIKKALDNIPDIPRSSQPKVSPTLKARNINDNEHKEIIDWEKWEIDRIWHLMRGTELWLNVIEQPKGFYKGHRWSVENFERLENMKNYEIGKVYHEKKYFVACKDGKIYLSINFSWVRFILNIIYGDKQ